MTRRMLIAAIRGKYRHLDALLNERTRRRWAATESQALGRGGVTLVREATGIARGTIYAGLRELAHRNGALEVSRLRKIGGGRKKVTEKDPGLVESLDALIEPTTRGDPQSPLRWTSLSTTHLANELSRQTHRVSQRTVCALLHQHGYSLQANRKTKEGRDHPDRDAQFRAISAAVTSFQERNQPVISVDTKKKELIGNFKNPGREWRPKTTPVEVKVHDFVDPRLGKVIPYGVYDLSRNEGWGNVGVTHDTASFAVASIRRWWSQMGTRRYPHARELLITADCGGSNGNRTRLWKRELQQLADHLRMVIHVRHFPPGTRKWNNIEHRLCSFISKNWRGRPLISRAAVVDLIAHTHTAQGLQVHAALDTTHYETGRKVPDEEMAQLRLVPDEFHGEWNYKLIPRK